MTKKTKVEKVPEPEYDKGIVIYSDGGCRQDGKTGWGLHGYHYELHPLPKGSGNTAWQITNDGYVSKKALLETPDPETKLETGEFESESNTNKIVQVKTINYIDGFGSMGIASTNNVAELLATSNALTVGNKYDIKDLTLFTDSKYVVDGITKWLPKWQKNNFIKSDGTEVSSKDIWLDLNEQLNKLTNKNVNVNIKWIKAHNGHIGNELADKYATLGVYNAVANVARTEIDYLPAAGYWNYQAERHPFLYNKKAYFLTRVGSNEPGKYFLGDHGRDDEIMGTVGTIAYVELFEPSSILEHAIDLQRELTPNTDIITYVNLDKLFKGCVVRDIERFGTGCLYRHSKHRIDLSYSDGELITRGLVPPRLAMRTIEDINSLCGVLQAFKVKDSNLTITDITDCFYKLNDKGDNILKEDITSNTEKITTEILYEGDKKYNLSLFLGPDMPGRNNLKKLEKLNPKVSVITWMESPECFKYATVISVDNGIGIWSSITSNMKLLVTKKGKL